MSTLPQETLGAWCSQEPFYVPRGEQMDATDIYLSSSCLLPMTFWQVVDEAAVTDSDLAELLHISREKVGQHRDDRQLFYQVVNQLFHKNTHNNTMCEPLAKRLLSRLGASGLNSESAMWWADVEITLNWEDYTICYLLPKCLAETRRQMREIANQKLRAKNPVWLCLGETEPPADLSGLVLGINPEETLALLHTNDEQEAARLLNRIVARQHGANPNATFRAAGGLGTLVAKHFGGRTRELETLKTCLQEADAKGASALIVGGRRIGKTSLRERILFEIKTEPRQRKRICLEFNFESDGEDPLRVGIELEFWFFKRMQAAFAKTRFPFNDQWSRAQRSNVQRRDHARKLLEAVWKLLARATRVNMMRDMAM